jgi:hypothetical protein
MTAMHIQDWLLRDSVVSGFGIHLCGGSALILYAPDDHSVVAIAAGDFASDMARVSGCASLMERLKNSGIFQAKNQVT